MDIQKIELMKALQREYYGELKKKNGDRLKEDMKFLYQLLVAFVVILLALYMATH